MKKMLKRLIKTEKGQALPTVLILMVLGGLILAPTLTYTTSGLKVGQAYEGMAEEFYAADAGIEDGMWQIKYDHLEDLFDDYERYDYDTTYEYPTTYLVDVNNIEVEVEIENVWIPDIDEPTDLDEANRLAEGGKLIIIGGVPGELTQQVKIYYYKEEGDPDLYITSIGIWLPPGFSYDEDGECTLETWLDNNPEVGYSRDNYPYKSGEAIVWTFSEPALFTDLPGVSELDSPMTCSFIFNFERDNPESHRNPEAVSWITTSGVSDIPYTWDADVRVFHINSVANSEGGTTVDAYVIKTEIRELGSTISGDYLAIGNSLTARSRSYLHYQDILLEYSSATVENIPANAHVDKALLYWSAYTLGEGEETIVFNDNCSNGLYEWWIPGADWEEYQSWSPGGWNWYFGAHHDNGDAERELIMRDPLGLSTYDEEDIIFSLNYWESGSLESNDCLQYAFFDGSVWSDWEDIFCGNTYGTQTFEVEIPEEYRNDEFKIKIRIDGFDGTGGGWWGGGDETCYIDNIRVTAESLTIADIEITFEINGEQVYLEDDEYGNPTVPLKGEQSLFADEWQVMENLNYGEPAGYSYSCKADVTALVQWDEATDGHGNATYTVADVYADVSGGNPFREWAYAGWSLIIIYSSPDTQGHQLYLYDDFLYCDHYTNLDFDQDGSPGGTISGFLVPDPIRDPDTGEIIEEIAAAITCFVGEGDDWYEGDYFQFNGTKLDDGTSSLNDVWNGRSIGMSAEGVDVDTFYTYWDDDLLEPGDTSAQIDIWTDIDVWNLIYVILSFRSATVTGGTVTYLIEG